MHWCRRYGATAIGTKWPHGHRWVLAWRKDDAGWTEEHAIETESREECWTLTPDGVRQKHTM
eukprot:4066144-Pyramimonas_sp.AAC.1